jgi:hypothetical protein
VCVSTYNFWKKVTYPIFFWAPCNVSCDHNSGETFPIGETVVTCNAEDLEGNRAKEESFTITVEDTTAPDVELQKQ